MSSFAKGQRALATALAASLALSACASLGGGQRRGAGEEEEAERRAMQYFVQAKVYESQKNYLGAIVALRNAADLDSTLKVPIRFTLRTRK